MELQALHSSESETRKELGPGAWSSPGKAVTAVLLSSPNGHPFCLPPSLALLQNKELHPSSSLLFVWTLSFPLRVGQDKTKLIENPHFGSENLY